jgi:hypothetical protein
VVEHGRRNLYQKECEYDKFCSISGGFSLFAGFQLTRFTKKATRCEREGTLICSGIIRLSIGASAAGGACSSWLSGI